MKCSSRRSGTLILSGGNTEPRARDNSAHQASLRNPLSPFNVLCDALRNGSKIAEHVERVLLVGATATQYAELLASLRPGFSGDVVLVRGDGPSRIDAGRGEDRAPPASDLDSHREDSGLLGVGRRSLENPPNALSPSLWSRLATAS